MILPFSSDYKVCDPVGPFHVGNEVHNFKDHKSPLAMQNEEPKLNELSIGELMDLLQPYTIFCLSIS